MREIWDWDDSVYLGSIPEANHTFNVIGNINEHGLIIGETTFGGNHTLDGHGSSAIMDYGSLIWVTLQRAKTAREAIHMMDALCQEYGYESDGESFSVADQNEVWLMELIGKGKEKGAVWVASRVPEGFVGSTANQARTRQFVQTDPDNVLFAKDVVTFAQSKGLYPKDAPAADFSFCDAYDPLTFTGARLAEARVWNLFRQIGGAEAMDPYLDYAQGTNLTNRMPLFVKAAKKLSVNDTMWNMRTHFENTWFDNEGVVRADVGAGPGNSPYRWRPLTWKIDGDTYVNERTIGVQQVSRL
jgi:dipeptidase